jgi:hypothetical protein
MKRTRKRVLGIWLALVGGLWVVVALIVWGGFTRPILLTGGDLSDLAQVVALGGLLGLVLLVVGLLDVALRLTE